MNQAPSDHAIKIPPRLTRERFVKAPPCRMDERTSERRPQPTPVQDQDKADIIGRGDLHYGVDDDICKKNPAVTRNAVIVWLNYIQR